MEIERTWVLNCRHLRQRTVEDLTNWVYMMTYEHGWMIAVPDDFMDDGAPEELSKLIYKASLVGVQWIRLDTDAPIYDRLPHYDWDLTPMNDLKNQLEDK